MKNQEFILTEQHIKLLSAAYVSWEHCEFGAPSIDCKRPYGNGDVFEDMAGILGIEITDSFPTPLDEKILFQLHKELKTALQIVLRTKSFEPGLYTASPYEQNWKLATS